MINTAPASDITETCKNQIMAKSQRILIDVSFFIIRYLGSFLAFNELRFGKKSRDFLKLHPNINIISGRQRNVSRSKTA